jgi:hypothetical protein
MLTTAASGASEVNSSSLADGSRSDNSLRSNSARTTAPSGNSSLTL